MPSPMNLYDLVDGRTLVRDAITANEAVINDPDRYTLKRPDGWEEGKRHASAPEVDEGGEAAAAVAPTVSATSGAEPIQTGYAGPVPHIASPPVPTGPIVMLGDDMGNQGGRPAAAEDRGEDPKAGPMGATWEARNADIINPNEHAVEPPAAETERAPRRRRAARRRPAKRTTPATPPVATPPAEPADETKTEF